MQVCLDRGADANGLSEDQRDNPLSVCVRFDRAEALELLLRVPGIRVDACVNPYHSGGPADLETVGGKSTKRITGNSYSSIKR